MYRLLVVDDEEFITDGMAELLQNNKELDLDVYKAYSGEEAIEWLRRTRMDIVLSDIHMPMMDGMQLLKEIKCNWPTCRVIFLSGYDDFSYVYEAIKYPGTKYLLKSENHNKVLDAVKETLEEIGRDLRVEDIMRRAQQELHAARETFQKDYCLRLLHGSTENLTDAELLTRLEIKLNPREPVLVLLGRLDADLATKEYSDLMQIQFSMRWVFNRYLNRSFHDLTVFDEEGRIVSLLQPKAADKSKGNPEQRYQEAIDHLKGTLELVQSACKASINNTVSLIITDLPVEWNQIANKYEKLTRMMNCQMGNESEILLTDTALDSALFGYSEPSVLPLGDAAEAQIEQLLGQRFEEMLSIQLHSGNEQSFMEKLHPIVKYLRGEPSRNNGLALEVYLRLAVTLLSYINSHHLTQELAFHIGQNQLIRPDSFANWTEAVNYLETMIHTIFTLQKEAGKRRTDTAVAYIQEYVAMHLGEDLSLVRLAEQVFLNPSYLSRLFKQATGTNLSDFIEHIRIKRAKALLLGDNVRIQEVACAVGYDTAGSFTRFFKQATGMAPQEYRMVHLEKMITRSQDSSTM